MRLSFDPALSPIPYGKPSRLRRDVGPIQFGCLNGRRESLSVDLALEGSISLLSIGRSVPDAPSLARSEPVRGHPVAVPLDHPAIVDHRHRTGLSAVFVSGGVGFIYGGNVRQTPGRFLALSALGRGSTPWPMASLTISELARIRPPGRGDLVERTARVGYAEPVKVDRLPGLSLRFQMVTPRCRVGIRRDDVGCPPLAGNAPIPTDPRGVSLLTTT